MNLIDDTVRLELSRALFLFSDATARSKPLLEEKERWRVEAIRALARAIIQFVESYGTICRSEDRKYWYRALDFADIPGSHGLQEMISEVFGTINWFDLYRPALEIVAKTHRVYFFGKGDCAVHLCERLSSSQAAYIRICRIPFTPL